MPWGYPMRSQIQTVTGRKPSIEIQCLRLYAHFSLSTAIASMTKLMQALSTW
jgi:hypothetical protein